jgi:hypothetical protein
LTITATILARTGTLSNGATVPASDVVLTTTIPFYKFTNPYHVSGANNLSVNTNGAAGEFLTACKKSKWHHACAVPIEG